MPSDSLPHDRLEALAAKYRTMVVLRERLPRAGARGLTHEERAELRALARTFPGALRELDSMPTEAIVARRDSLEAALAGGPVASWMVWLDGYHTLMRVALALRRTPFIDFATLARVARETGVLADEAFARAVAAPPHGRLMAAVFDRLGALHGEDPRAIWDVLFPGQAARDYRR